jgi:Sap, sulfolipid-1-addressing protein
VISVDIELALVGLVAMLEPATLISSALVLVIGERPLRTGLWFYVGGAGVTLAIGVLGALLLGSGLAAPSSETRTGVLIFDVIAGTLLLLYAARTLLRPAHPEQTAHNLERMNSIAAAPALTIVGAGALLANAGPFMLVALKGISELDPSTLQYILDWLLFTVVSLLPLGLGLIMLRMAPSFTTPRLAAARGFIERHARTIAAVVLVALGISLLREGVAGLTG